MEDMNSVGLDEQFELDVQEKTKRKGASYMLLYRDGETIEDLTKAEATKILTDDDGSGEIKGLYKGSKVPFEIKKVSSVSING